MTKKEKTTEFPNKPFTMADPLSLVLKVHENAKNIKKLTDKDKHVSSDNVLLKNFREEMKNGNINSSQYNANKEHKGRLDKTKGAIKQVVEALDKIETKNEEQDEKISELESAGPVIINDVDVVSSNAELKNNNIKQDIKVINDRLGKVEGWTPPTPAEIIDENVGSTNEKLGNENIKQDIEVINKRVEVIEGWTLPDPVAVVDKNVASTNSELNNVNIKEDIQVINDRLIKVENWAPPEPTEIKDIDVLSTTSLGNDNVKEDIEQLKTEIASIDTGGNDEYSMIFSGTSNNVEFNDDISTYKYIVVEILPDDSEVRKISGMIPTELLSYYNGTESYCFGIECIIFLSEDTITSDIAYIKKVKGVKK